MNKIDFILLFDALDANPNGDPDAGNLPRIDVETQQGLVTDVCIKRKIRNYVEMTHQNEDDQDDSSQSKESNRYEIYVTEKEVLNDQHKRAYAAHDLKPEAKKLPKKLKDAEKVRQWMCRNFFDIRTFGAVMSMEVNCGQVRGPVQISFARSIDSVVSSEFAVTRCAVTNEKDREKERTIGRKYTVPYALYRAHGTINPFLAKQTGFDEKDLKVLIEALTHLFDFDASAARPAGSMNVRKLILFKHDSELGNAHAHKLYDSVTVTRKAGVDVPRSFDDYEVEIGELPEGIKLETPDC